jgi:hypothetical protein
MHFFEPEPLDEFVSKLSSISTKPNPETWESISRKLDEFAIQRRWSAFKKLSLAASILIIISIGSSFLLVNYFNYRPTLFTYWESNNVLFDKTPDEERSIPHKGAKPIVSALLNFQNTLPTISLDSSENAAIPQEQPVTITPIARKEISFNTNLSSTSIDESLPSRIQFEPTSFSSLTSTISIEKQADDTNDDKTNSTWSLIAYLNPSYSSQSVPSMGSTPDIGNSKSWMLGGEVMVKKQIGNYFSIYSGLLVSPAGFGLSDIADLANNSIDSENQTASHTQSIEPKNGADAFSFMSNINRSSLFLNKSPYESQELQQRYYYMEIPLIVSTSFKRGPVNIEVKLGCSAGILVDNKFEVIKSDDLFIGQTEEIRPHNAALLGAISFSLPINNKINIIVEPSLKYHLYPLSYSYTASYPLASTVKFGMGYRF